MAPGMNKIQRKIMYQQLNEAVNNGSVTIIRYTWYNQIRYCYTVIDGKLQVNSPSGSKNSYPSTTFTDARPDTFAPSRTVL